jgi:hypothetical protein
MLPAFAFAPSLDRAPRPNESGRVFNEQGYVLAHELGRYIPIGRFYQLVAEVRPDSRGLDMRARCSRLTRTVCVRARTCVWACRSTTRSILQAHVCMRACYRLESVDARYGAT